MEILTLLKADIKYKKSAFIGVAVLTLLIVATAVAVLGVRQNYDKAWKQAQSYSDIANANVFLASEQLTDELLDSVRNSSLVERIEVFDSLVSMGSVDAPNASDGNSYFLFKMHDGLRLYNENADGFESTIPKLKKGEIYLPYGLRAKLSCEIQDVINIEMLDGRHEFTISGFIQEPTMGAYMIGWKQVFISDEDYREIYEASRREKTEHVHPFISFLRIYKSDPAMTDSKFQRELNLETGIINQAFGSITTQLAQRYTGLFTEIITDVVLGFVALLFVIVLVVIHHSIKTEIEIHYVNLGILKSQGFSDRRITLLLALRYMLAECLGILFGFMISIPLERYMSNLFLSITAILPERSIAFGKSLLFIAGILGLSVLLIYLCTRKVAKISPVRAISGGRDEIYFASRLNAPISKKMLLSSIAFRCFTAAKRRYFGIVFVTAMLTFFAITVNILGSSLQSQSSLENMGYVMTDLDIYFTDSEAQYHVKEMEQLVEKYSPITKKHYMLTQYASLNGENLYVTIYQYPEYISGMLKGRQPLYDNEVIITYMVADELGLKIGDTVTVSGKKKEAEYLICGIFQTSSDSGMAFAMSLDGAKRLGDAHISYMGMALEDASQAKQIAEALNENFGDMIEAQGEDNDQDQSDDPFDLAVLAIRIVIYVFSGIFALVTVIMVCREAFSQERTDIGIYKAIGFTCRKLRTQFAVRFFIVSLIGGVIGCVAGSLFSASILNIIFGLFGISRVTAEYNFFTFAGAVAFVSLCVLVFAYLVSGRVKRVEIRELVTE